jgi:hypothetical protein
MKKSLCAVTLCAVFVSGCMPAEVIGQAPDGNEIRVMFYPGGTVLDDLIIIDGVNYFGSAQYQMDDPLGDVGFRLSSGPRVQAECVSTRQDFMGNDECVRYEVYRSSFDLIPEGSTFNAPSIF